MLLHVDLRTNQSCAHFKDKSFSLFFYFFYALIDTQKNLETNSIINHYDVPINFKSTSPPNDLYVENITINNHGNLSMTSDKVRQSSSACLCVFFFFALHPLVFFSFVLFLPSLFLSFFCFLAFTNIFIIYKRKRARRKKK